jgi:hypothetical protein
MRINYNGQACIVSKENGVWNDPNTKYIITDHDLYDTTVLNLTDVIMNQTIQIINYTCFKKGNKIFLWFYCSGSIVSQASGSNLMFYVKEGYRPVLSKQFGIAVNSHLEGQVYTPASFIVGNSGDCYCIFPSINTQYGNNTYPWHGGYGISLEWDIY